MASPIPPVLIELQADISQLKKGLAEAQNALAGMDGSVKTASAGVNNFTSTIKKLGMVAGVTFGASQIVNFFQSAVAESNKAQAAQARLTNLLLNTNGATQKQIDLLGKQARALEQVGVVSADNITAAQSQLATFDLTAASIETLTPAILNYVTAEKGANATTEEFKQMTNGLAQAMQGNFASLTKTGFILDAATKKTIAHGSELERSRAIVEVLNSTYADFNKNLRNTSEGGMQVAINNFNNLKQKIGAELVPTITQFIGTLTSKVIPALEKLVDFLVKNKETIVAVTQVLIAGAAAYATYRTAIIVAGVTTQAFRVIMTLMKGAQLATIASTNGLAASILVMNAVIKANPIGVVITALTLLAAGFAIAWKNSETFRNAMVKVFQVIINGAGYLVGAIGSLLTAASKIPKIGDQFKGPAEAVNETANDIRKFSDSLDKLAKKQIDIKTNVKTATTGTDVRTGNEVIISDKEMKARAKAAKERAADLEKAQKDVTNQYKKLADQENKRAQLIADYEKDVARKRLEYDEKVADIKKNNAKSVAKAQTTYAEQSFKIEKDYQNKIVTATKEAAEKRASIVQTSIDRLRDIFKTATSLDVGKIYSDLLGGDQPLDATVENIINKLKNKLANSKNLLTQTQGLKDKGFSQTFIEQIVGQGTEIGTQLAQKINEATPETIKELQTLFLETEANANTGIDALATSMNTGMKLATQELIKAYAEVGTELNTKLTEYAVEFEEAMTTAKTQLNEALTELAAELVESLAEARKDLDRVLADMQDSFTQALSTINSEIQETITAITTLMTLMSSLGGSATYGKIGAGVSSNGTITAPSDFGLTPVKRGEESGNVNINITNYQTQSDSDTADAILRAYKYGQTVTVGAYDK